MKKKEKGTIAYDSNLDEIRFASKVLRRMKKSLPANARSEVVLQNIPFVGFWAKSNAAFGNDRYLNFEQDGTGVIIAGLNDVFPFTWKITAGATVELTFSSPNDYDVDVAERLRKLAGGKVTIRYEATADLLELSAGKEEEVFYRAGDSLFKGARPSQVVKKSFATGEGLKKLAQSGNAEAALIMARYYLPGYSSPAEGTTWLNKASELGNTIAQYMNGIMNYCGNKTAKNREVGERWMRMAAKTDYAPAIVFLDRIEQGRTKTTIDHGYTNPLNYRERDGAPSLQVAISKNRKEQVEILIRAGADVNMRDERGMTPLMYAAMYGSVEIVELLHKAGADINAVTSLDNPLTIAIRMRNNDIVRYLVRAGAAVNGAAQGGVSSLAAAVEQGDAEIISLILGAGADVKNKDGGQALLWAAREGQQEITASLIQKRVSLNIKTTEGKTAIRVAFDHNHAEIMRMLLNTSMELGKDDAKEILPWAAGHGEAESVRALVRRKVDLNAMNLRYHFALDEAVKAERTDIVRILLQAGADPNRKTAYPVLINAVSGNRLEAARLLIRNGADVNGRDALDNTSLMIAAKTGNPDMVRLLIESGADATANNRQNRDSFWIAVSEGNGEALKMLFTTTKRKMEDYPWMIVAVVKENNVKAVNAWITAGGPINCTIHNTTPLVEAARLGNKKIIDLLLKAGADLNYMAAGPTALGLAIKNNDKDLVHMLEKASAKE
ncbi:MAG: hypothetical protein A2X58_14065 [Nitrospirae bacterium GWC2_56_14]|nr:MAG: hypothetical protein A2X58_14065 [Nitrospirae bacterium GWC2_56_14]